MAYSSRTKRVELPEVPRSADVMVLLLLIVSLLGAWALRDQTLSATSAAAFGGVTFSVPARALPLSDGDQFATQTSAGLAVRANQYPLPSVEAGLAVPTGNVTGTLTLVASSWALSQAAERDMFRVIDTQPAQVAGRDAIIHEYAYVANDGIYSTALEVVHGYAAVIVTGDTYTVIALDGPDAVLDDIEAFWPRLLASMRIS